MRRAMTHARRHATLKHAERLTGGPLRPRHGSPAARQDYHKVISAGFGFFFFFPFFPFFVPLGAFCSSLICAIDVPGRREPAWLGYVRSVRSASRG